MNNFDVKNDPGGTWINIYKLHNKEIYWSGSTGYSTKEAALYNNACENYRIATLNIKDVLSQQAEINKLREVTKKQDEFIEHMWINHPIVRGHVTLLNKVHNARKALNGESEGK